MPNLWTNMEKNKLIFLFWILFLILPNISALIISEIMYAPLESEFYNEYIEIYNDGESYIDLTNFTLCEDLLLSGYVDKGESGNLKLNDSMILTNGNYAIITDGGSGTEVYSNFNANTNALALHVDSASICGGLVNGGETLNLKDSSGNLISSVTYSGNLANNNDKSMQICSSSWIEEEPTPGRANICQTQTPQMQNQTQTQTPNNQNNNLSSAKPTIEAYYPKNASLNQEFNFKIKLMNFAQGIYDIKIDILSNGTRIANILNDGQWKSTNYYLTDAINQNEEKEFSIKIIEKFENAEITIKIKDSAEKIEIFQGYFLYKGNEIRETKNETTTETIYLNAPLTNAPDLNENKENRTPVLDEDSKDIKSEENTEKLNKSNYAKYILTAFIFLLALLFLFKKIFKKRYQNEFKN